MNKRFSELTVSAADFANDDVIALDGETNGTRKMSGSALKSAMKTNTLATTDSNAYIVSDGDVVRIKDLAASITDFRDGDVILVDGPSGNAKMPASNLLELTSRLVVFNATFTPSSGTYQWPDAAEVASAVASGKGVAIDLATQGNVVRYYLHYTNGSSVYIFESTSFSRITMTSGAYALVSMIDTELKADSANPVTNSAITAIIGNVEAALAGL